MNQNLACKKLARNPFDSFPVEKTQAEPTAIQGVKSGLLATKLLHILSEFQRIALGDYYRSKFILSSNFEQ